MHFDAESNTVVELTRAEALVLFDWLHALEDADATPGDEPERIALWALSYALEKVLVEPFLRDYDVAVSAARQHLIPPEE